MQSNLTTIVFFAIFVSLDSLPSCTCQVPLLWRDQTFYTLSDLWKSTIHWWMQHNFNLHRPWQPSILIVFWSDLGDLMLTAAEQQAFHYQQLSGHRSSTTPMSKKSNAHSKTHGLTDYWHRIWSILGHFWNKNLVPAMELIIRKPFRSRTQGTMANACANNNTHRWTEMFTA